jgi:23S rRNA (cytidine1920-2'-O)/16S rRNA (cytidine1409-2'-O)-methyltransferase
MKKRLDQLLLERGLAESRQKAQALIIAGRVLLDGRRSDKPGRLVDAAAALEVAGGMPFASRAGEKLDAALKHFGISVSGRVCADLGASTGGFTDCLLQRGARLVQAFDVGKAQLDWRLRQDGRVVVRDQVNVRFLGAEDLADATSFVSADLSFISLAKVLTPLRDALRGGRALFPVDLVLLVKPQFEVGKGKVGKGGVIRDESLRLRALESVISFSRGAGFRVLEHMDSPVAGARGNVEFLLHLQLDSDL